MRNFDKVADVQKNMTEEDVNIMERSITDTSNVENEFMDITGVDKEEASEYIKAAQDIIEKAERGMISGSYDFEKNTFEYTDPTKTLTANYIVRLRFTNEFRLKNLKIALGLLGYNTKTCAASEFIINRVMPKYLLEQSYPTRNLDSIATPCGFMTGHKFKSKSKDGITVSESAMEKAKVLIGRYNGVYKRASNEAEAIISCNCQELKVLEKAVNNLGYDFWYLVRRGEDGLVLDCRMAPLNTRKWLVEGLKFYNDVVEYYVGLLKHLTFCEKLDGYTQKVFVDSNLINVLDMVEKIVCFNTIIR